MVRFSDAGGEADTTSDGLAPVTPLFRARPATRDGSVTAEPIAATGGAVEPDAGDHTPEGGGWHRTWVSERRGLADEADAADDESATADLAEKALLKKLRTRSMSIAEARGLLRGFEIDAAAADRVIDSMVEYGYLDDSALAEQLIHAGADRKGHGRQVIAQTLAKRGIPRDVAEAALAALPDDDLERALEFARGKARTLRGVDRDTALRRLTGQLARRGYGGAISMTAARTALDEGAAGSSTVRFR